MGQAESDAVRLVHATGFEPLVTLLANGEQFRFLDETQSTIYSTIPVEGAGKPGQSESDS